MNRYTKIINIVPDTTNEKDSILPKTKKQYPQRE